MEEVANKLESPEGLAGAHDVFHVSQLKKFHAVMADIPLWGRLTLERIIIFHEVDFGQNKYELCLDMWGVPRVWMDEVLLDIKEV